MTFSLSILMTANSCKLTANNFVYSVFKEPAFYYTSSSGELSIGEGSNRRARKRRIAANPNPIYKNVIQHHPLPFSKSLLVLDNNAQQYRALEQENWP